MYVLVRFHVCYWNYAKLCEDLQPRFCWNTAVLFSVFHRLGFDFTALLQSVVLTKLLAHLEYECVWLVCPHLHLVSSRCFVIVEMRMCISPLKISIYTICQFLKCFGRTMKRDYAIALPVPVFGWGNFIVGTLQLCPILSFV